MNIKHPQQSGRWRTIKALAERVNAGADSPTFTDHGIRHLVRNADSNGLAPYVRRLGRKILIDESGFYNWIENRTQGGRH